MIIDQKMNGCISISNQIKKQRLVLPDRVPQYSINPIFTKPTTLFRLP